MLGEKRLAEKSLANIAIAGAGLMFLACVAVIALGSVFGADLRTALPGTKAPEIVSKDVDNQDLALSGLRGNCVLVYFQPDPVIVAASTDTSPDSANPSSTPTSAADKITADLLQLKQLSAALDARQVTILESNGTPSEQPMQLMSVSARSFANLSEDPRRGNRMLLDADGQIARNYRVDTVAAVPTLFIIDADGVIRYRGNVDQVAASDLVHQLMPVNSGKQLSMTSKPSLKPIESLASLDRF